MSEIGILYSTLAPMIERIKTTLRLPKNLHDKFDAGTMNADIVTRLENSFKDEWRGDAMSANNLLGAIELPEVLRVKTTGNGHEDMVTLCALLAGLPVEAVLMGVNKEKRLVLVMQLAQQTLVADRLAFVLDSAGRAQDMSNLIACLDQQDLLTGCQSSIRAVEAGQSPREALDLLYSQDKKTGLKGVQELCHVLNPSYTVEL